MCRSIKILFNFEPPVTDQEIRSASLQFVRKISGFANPSQANAAAFNTAVTDIEAACRTLLRSLRTHAPARNREQEAVKVRARTSRRPASP